MRCPTGRVPKQPDRADRFFAAEVEPMHCPGRHTDQIAGFHFDRNDISIFRSNMKQPTALNDKSHFIVIVPMLLMRYTSIYLYSSPTKRRVSRRSRTKFARQRMKWSRMLLLRVTPSGL